MMMFTQMNVKKMANIIPVHTSTGISQVLICAAVWKVSPPSKKPLNTRLSETVNHEGIYLWKSAAYSFSGVANQNGCVRAPITKLIIVYPQTVDSITSIT